jgi:hypothetical protein
MKMTATLFFVTTAWTALLMGAAPPGGARAEPAFARPLEQSDASPSALSPEAGAPQLTKEAGAPQSACGDGGWSSTTSDAGR